MSRVTRGDESRRARVEGRTPISGHPRAGDLGFHEPSPLHTRRVKTQHHENSSSTSTNTALSVSCTRTLCELHPPLPALLPSSCSWALASLFLRVVLLYHPLFPLALRCLAASLSVRTVGNTLSPMLQTAGTTVRSRRKHFNRPWSISLSSSFPLEAA